MGKGYLFKDSEAARSIMEKMVKHRFRAGSMLLLTEEEFNVAKNNIIEIDIPDPKEPKEQD